jgi:DNA-binding beta-propeller fold protein YncE
VALVTAETRSQLLAVDVRTGRVRRRIALAADPENVVVGAVAVVASPAAGTVTVLDPGTLHVVAELHGFTSPHIPVIAPGGRYAYVTDDAAGTVTPIRLNGARELPPVPVGLGAHHLTLSPDGTRLWIALGESARAIVILDTTDPAHPRVLRRFDPGFAVHDVLFSPNGREVWIGAASGPDVTVIDAHTLSVLFRVPVGPPPQHVAFDRAEAYLTSGYGGTIEGVDAGTDPRSGPLAVRLLRARRRGGIRRDLLASPGHPRDLRHATRAAPDRDARARDPRRRDRRPAAIGSVLLSTLLRGDQPSASRCSGRPSARHA